MCIENVFLGFCNLLMKLFNDLSIIKSVMIMKIAFDKLKNKAKIFIILIFTIVSLGLIITAYCIENDYIKIVLGSFALILLVFLFLFLVFSRHSAESEILILNHFR